MQKAPTSRNEQKRIAALQAYNILDTASEQDFDELTQLASAICGTPIALISLVDKDRQWFKSRHGFNVTETDRALSFCAHAINKPNDMLEVEDARSDERFKDNALVTGDPNIVFYAGMPLVDEEGYALGSLCVIDHERRQLNEQQQLALKILAGQVISKLKLRKKLLELENAGKRIQKLNTLLTLKEREAMQIIEHTPMSMALHTGEDMKIIFANKMMLKAWGKDSTVFGMPFNVALPELAALDFPKTMRQVYRKGIPYEQSEAHMSYLHEGQIKEFYYTYSFTPLKLEDGTVWGLLNTAYDVTQNVKSRENVELAEERLRLAVQSAELGTFYLDSATHEFVPSPRLKELFGFDPEEEVSLQAAFAQIAESHRHKVASAVNASLTLGSAFDIEYPVIGYHDKVQRWVRATGKVYASAEQGKAPFFSGTILDITERKQDEQRKNDFIGMVSHELRSPLTSISGYIQMLKLKATKSNEPTITDIAEKAKRQVDRMSGLISGFLDVARLGEGKIKLNCERFNIARLLTDAEEEVLATVSTHVVNFANVEDTVVNADIEKIGQVLTNFINNAVKYSPFNSTIVVSCTTSGQVAKISVTDEGMGIPAEDQAHVFERFYRVESEQMKVVKGFGIGLYICKEIIESHGGKIGVNSKLDYGSTFWFELPVAQTE
ncbi:ATP-binding protein [uncultured Mucilaginibacter sp.]|uniref:ATP-binding protein n=1 Tax=uncultured Mucilaginibacter sp. TaxID=797541 RepID=UPI0025CEB0E3|nr:ATP-binding protein [uncultured Mucilaginibacter sp.]